MSVERIVFAEEKLPDQHVKLVAMGEVDAIMLTALEGYIARQRERLTTKPDQE